MKQCSSCNKEIADFTKYCPACGGKQDNFNPDVVLNSKPIAPPINTSDVANKDPNLSFLSLGNLLLILIIAAGCLFFYYVNSISQSRSIENYEKEAAKAAGYSSYADLQRSEDENKKLSANGSGEAANFLIGKCIVSAGEYSEKLIDYACDESTARMFPGQVVPYFLYKEKTVQIYLIYGDQVRSNPQIPSNLQPNDQLFEYPLEYRFISTNKIIVETVGFGGCIVQEEFEMRDNEIFQKALPQMGNNCSASQIASNKFELQRGLVKVFYKQVN
jgi:hypothetical protein